MQGREIDVRVSIIPMIHGEGIVMRLLDKGRMAFNLQDVGMLPDIYGTFKQLIDRPHGIVLVTGPTGSGKTTTLYAALNEIKDEATKIITVEDPVEYQQDGHQPDPGAREDRPDVRATRCGRILRHDPDVILDRRNPRPGDGRDGDPGVADRPPGVQHAAHQRRARARSPG